jgi:hypothetical protein
MSETALVSLNHRSLFRPARKLYGPRKTGGGIHADPESGCWRMGAGVGGRGPGRQKSPRAFCPRHPGRPVRSKKPALPGGGKCGLA